MTDLEKNLATYSVYLEELRSKLVFLTKIFVGAFAFGFFMTTPAVRFMVKHLNMPDVTIVTTSPFQLAELAMSVGFSVACVVIIPVFIQHMYAFLRPGLLPEERKSFLMSLPLGLGLFLLGFSYGCAILYYGIKLITAINISLGIANYWDISTFISQIVMTSSLLGILFIFPIIITFLIRLGLMSVELLRSKRRHVVVIIFIIVSLLPPTDGISLVLMSGPLILIFELTVLFNRRQKYYLISQ